MHFDHANNVGAFANADVYVQWEEYQGWLKALSLPDLYTPLGEESWITSSFDRDDARVFGELARDHRLKFVGDDDELAPGIRGHLSKDGHTFGTQWISVEHLRRALTSSPATRSCGTRTSRRCGRAATRTATPTPC